jgi:hypothetical protein
VQQLRVDTTFELEVVSIDGDPALEARYREHLPVVEIDGERAFTYFVEANALRERLTVLSRPSGRRWQNRDDLSQEPDEGETWPNA